MLKKENRLKTKEFEKVFKTGQKRFSQNFFLVFLDNQENKKISTSVSKKIYKKAVKRNRARRIIYDILQKKINEIPENKWMVLIQIKPILDLDRKKIESEITWILRKK